MTQETYLVLVLVDHRTVDVPVPRTDRRFDLIASTSRVNLCSQTTLLFELRSTYGILNFVRLREPSAQTNLGDLVAGRQGNILSVRHSVRQRRLV